MLHKQEVGQHLHMFDANSGLNAFDDHGISHICPGSKDWMNMRYLKFFQAFNPVRVGSGFGGDGSCRNHFDWNRYGHARLKLHVFGANSGLNAQTNVLYCMFLQASNPVWHCMCFDTNSGWKVRINMPYPCLSSLFRKCLRQMLTYWPTSHLYMSNYITMPYLRVL